ncbi:MAG: hypothetical protein ACLR67_00475 [Eggerthella lenta]
MLALWWWRWLLVLLLVLGVTSFGFVKKHMRTESWKRLQRWAYVFFGLVYVHLMLMLAPAASRGGRRRWSLWRCTRWSSAPTPCCGAGRYRPTRRCCSVSATAPVDDLEAEIAPPCCEPIVSQSGPGISAEPGEFMIATHW